MSAFQPAANPNLVYCETVVDALACAGLRAVCIAPGSRSTPLTLAFDAHPDVNVYLHLDERCASFFALGMAQASGLPVAIVCTSGTAALQFHAAVVEAQMAGVALLVLTSDRPPELRHSGANQTIDQVKMYGDHVLWAVDAALPEENAPDVALRNLRTLAARAFAIADGQRKGPVHINLPFRKPLEPPPPYRPRFESGQPVHIRHGVRKATTEQVDELAALIAAHERGWIVCGPLSGSPPCTYVHAVEKLARCTGYPIFADPLSGFRFGPQVGSGRVVGSYEGFLQTPPGFDPPQVVIRFGAVPTSKYLNDYLDRTAPPHQVHVRNSGVWADDSHRVRYFLLADEADLCLRLSERRPRAMGRWGEAVLAADKEWGSRQEQFLRENWFDASAVSAVLHALPNRANLFAGNSLPVRHLDQFGLPCQKEIHVFGNRGASGIDGVVSSALGVAAAEPETPMLLLIGDVSFYHDLNGLLAVRRHGLDNVTIVLLHNDGGGVFRRLPIAQDHAQFEKLFLTPHGLDFAPAAEMYGLDYVRICAEERSNRGRKALDRALAASLDNGGAAIIQIDTDGAGDEKLRRELVQIHRDSKENAT